MDQRDRGPDSWLLIIGVVKMGQILQPLLRQNPMKNQRKVCQGKDLDLQWVIA